VLKAPLKLKNADNAHKYHKCYSYNGNNSKKIDYELFYDLLMIPPGSIEDPNKTKEGPKAP